MRWDAKVEIHMNVENASDAKKKKTWGLVRKWLSGCSVCDFAAAKWEIKDSIQKLTLRVTLSTRKDVTQCNTALLSKALKCMECEPENTKSKDDIPKMQKEFLRWY